VNGRQARLKRIAESQGPNAARRAAGLSPVATDVFDGERPLEADPAADLALPRVIGLLSWYSESAVWLAATVASAASVCDHLVAVDGAYMLYPEGRNRSSSEQAAIITDTATACGVGVTVHTPQTVWEGNEVEKRSFMFALAETIAEPERDWYLVLDGDEVIVDVPSDFKARLAATDCDAGEVTFWEHQDPHQDPKLAEAARQFEWSGHHRYPIRTLFRAIPGLRVEGNHYTYVAPDDRILWGHQADASQVEALDCRDLVIEHRTHLRDLARRADAQRYYSNRNAAGIEAGTCATCGSEDAKKFATVDWELEEQGLTARTVPACEACFPALKEASDKALRELGFDPNGLAYQGMAAVA
jgi:hypothetical protein